MWDARTGAELAKLEGRIGPVMSVAVTPDGRIVIGSDDRTARVWDARTGAELAKLAGHGLPDFGGEAVTMIASTARPPLIGP